MKNRLLAVYKKLYAYFGPQHWWPGETPFEVMLGAILTQNTNWANVEKAIANLRRRGLLAPDKVRRLSRRSLAALIRPAGYYNLKSVRLKALVDFFFKHYGGSVRRMSAEPAAGLREKLLSVNGIGPETADSILLYAMDKSVFVIDAYTRRILLRHNFIPESAGYDQIQKLFMSNLRHDAPLFNEYHALLVRLGKDFCHKNKPRCASCPLN